MTRVRRTTFAAVAVLAGLLAVPQTAAAATCTATALPTPGGTTGYDVVGTTGDGTFVGSVVDGSGARHGVVWRGGAVTELDERFVPHDVNSSGLMGGYVIDQSTGRAVAAVKPIDGPARRLTASYSTRVAGVNE